MELVSREDAIKCLDGNVLITEQKEAEAVKEYFEMVIVRLKALPTIEERKEGRWIDTDYINLQLDTYLASCSECGYQMNVHNNRGYFKYCPNCGAKMYEDDKDIYVPNKGE